MEGGSDRLEGACQRSSNVCLFVWYMCVMPVCVRMYVRLEICWDDGVHVDYGWWTGKKR